MVRLVLLCAALAHPAHAFERITDGRAFARLIEGRALTRMGITLTVTPAGEISGHGMGRPVSGAWLWSDGYFCRTLAWGDRDLGYNCQAVLQNGDRLRFVSDHGTGDHADFRLR
ncbi:MAG: hypothetical protein Kow0013_09420 [Pararhodobacter sp.]